MWESRRPAVWRQGAHVSGSCPEASHLAHSRSIKSPAAPYPKLSRNPSRHLPPRHQPTAPITPTRRRRTPCSAPPQGSLPWPPAASLRRPRARGSQLPRRLFGLPRRRWSTAPRGRPSSRLLLLPRRLCVPGAGTPAGLGRRRRSARRRRTPTTTATSSTICPATRTPTPTPTATIWRTLICMLPEVIRRNQ
ncbi:hypothetical protein ACQJBY_011097 [Aegilops geniculata]